MRHARIKKINELFADFINKKNKTSNKEPGTISPMKIWTQVMGKHIMLETQAVSLDNNVLYIIIKNPYLRSDLFAQKNKILLKIQSVKPDIINISFK